eukprot:TRINITY_DN22429_c0_g1_i5.p1 TRINITY_DN22429_c0_g1~~TRINITY_DN22429_c0_g1_i5.p1  ORF type:complete len:508 (-),score=60.56 TRINITY_DN22429_c0_g1_i5:441-1964(-)
MMSQPQAYQALLEDTQASLSAALSRIEVLKARQRHLIHENYKLKQCLQEAGIAQPDFYAEETSTPQENVAQNAPPVLSTPKLQQDQQQQIPISHDSVQPKEDDFVDVMEDDGDTEVVQIQSDQDIQAIVITTEQDEIPGYVLVGPDQLEFLEVIAVIPSKDYVGVCPLPSPKDAEGYIRRKWWQSLAPINSTQRSKSQDWTSYLTRSSWASQVDHQQVLIDLAKDQTRYANSDYRGIVWKDQEQEGRVKAFDFRAKQSTRVMIQKRLDMWSGSSGAIMQSPPQPQHMEHDEGKWSNKEEEQPKPKQPPIKQLSMTPGGEIFQYTTPIHLEPCKSQPTVTDQSNLLSDLHFRCLNNHLPSRHRFSTWELVYSTSRHGISLQTLYRREHNAQPPTVLVVRDSGGYIFGCFASEQWKVHPRYYGSGETFVFQVSPHLIAHDWFRQSQESNEYFQYAQSDCLGVGGGPRFAIWLDGDLARGSSGQCATFGSACLASSEDFGVMEVEVWTLS